jgi:hypothetical protein
VESAAYELAAAMRELIKGLEQMPEPRPPPYETLLVGTRRALEQWEHDEAIAQGMPQWPACISCGHAWDEHYEWDGKTGCEAIMASDPGCRCDGYICPRKG